QGPDREREGADRPGLLGERGNFEGRRMNRIILYQGHVLAVLQSLPPNSVHCCVTSPPYWGLRRYLPEGDPLEGFQVGLEPTIEEYVAKIVEIFREVRRALRSDGCMFLNLGDSYYGGGGAHKESHANPGISKSASRCGVPKGPTTGRGERGPGKALVTHNGPNRTYQAGLKPKDLCMIPARVALALQADGWWLRSDIIWSKSNPMPESCTDRPTTSHEHIFLLTKAARYYYDNEAVREDFQGKDERQWAATYEEVGSILHEQSHAGIKRTKR